MAERTDSSQTALRQPRIEGPLEFPTIKSIGDSLEGGDGGGQAEAEDVSLEEGGD